MWRSGAAQPADGETSGPPTIRSMGNRPLPTGEAAFELALAHLFVTLPMRLDRPRSTELGARPLQAVIGGVSADTHGWLFAWVAYVPTVASAPALSVWPAAQTGSPFDAVLPAASDLELLARVDTGDRAVARLTHHLRMIVQARINPDMDYLNRAVAAYRAELRARRDRADALASQPPHDPHPFGS